MSAIPTNAPSRQSKSTWQPKPYMMEAMRFMVSRPAAGLFLDPGFGKTSVTLHSYEALRQSGHNDLLIVIAKLRIVTSTWPAEVDKWGLPIRYAVLHGPKRDAALSDHKSYDAFFTNYESLEWLVKKLPLLKGRKIMLVFDESSKLKDTRTARFKMAKKLAAAVPRRHILTGSPMPQSLMDVFGQTFILDLGETFSPYITQFRNEYFMPTGYMGYDWQPRPEAEKRIFDALKPLVLRLPPEIVKLPKIEFFDRYVSLPPAIRKMYYALEETYVTEIRSGVVTAANAAVAAGKLRQIVGGSLYGPDGTAEQLHTEKLEDLAELIDELQGDPVFVAYEYKHELAALLKRWPDAPYIGSGVSTKKADQIIKDFNLGKVPVLFAHPQSAAHGLNLQSCCRVVVWYSLTWSLENYEQFIQRIWRTGQTRNVRVYRIIASDTIDQELVVALDRKDRNQQRLLQSLEIKYEAREREKKKAPVAKRDSRRAS